MRRIKTKQESRKFGYSAIIQKKSSLLLNGETVDLEVDGTIYKTKLDEKGFIIED